MHASGIHHSRRAGHRSKVNLPLRAGVEPGKVLPREFQYQRCYHTRVIGKQGFFTVCNITGQRYSGFVQFAAVQTVVGEITSGIAIY